MEQDFSLSYSQAMEELQTIVEYIEENDPPVDELLQKTERAVLLIRQCREQLTRADEKVKSLLAALDPEGEPAASPEEE